MHLFNLQTCFHVCSPNRLHLKITILICSLALRSTCLLYLSTDTGSCDYHILYGVLHRTSLHCIRLVLKDPLRGDGLRSLYILDGIKS